MKPKIGDRVIIHLHGHNARSTTTWFDVEVVGLGTSVDSDSFVIQGKYSVGRNWLGLKKYNLDWFSQERLIALVDDEEKLKKEIEDLERMTGLE